MSASAQLVFVLQRPRGRFATMVSSLSALWDGELPPMDTVDASYDGTRDRVLICCHYNPRALTEGVRTRIAIIARDAGVVVLDGANLDASDRAALVAEGEHRVEGQPALAIALWSLSRLMGGEEVWTGPHAESPLVPVKGRAVTANELADRGGMYSLQRPKGPVGIVPPSSATPPPIPGRAPTPGSLPVPARTKTPSPPPLPPRTKTPEQLPSPSRAKTPGKLPVPPRTRTPDLPMPPRTTTGNGAPRDEIREEASARNRAARTSTLRDVVSPRAIGTRGPMQPGRSAEDGTAPKIDISGDPRVNPLPAGSSIDGLEPPSARRSERMIPRAVSDLGVPMFGDSSVPEPVLMTPVQASGSVPSLPALPGRLETMDGIDSGPITVADPIAQRSFAYGTDPEPYISSQNRTDASQIDVRYLRSGRWAPARLRALSLKGAYLITAAFPRVGDHVHIALGLGDLGALVRGIVFHVTTAADIASTGTSGFAVRFDLDDAAKAQLSVLLHRARARGVTITPPPPRGSIRLPVQWPVKLSTAHGAVKGDALDVSRGGMFVHAARTLDVDAPVSFSAVLDDGTAPVSGRARVVREINEADAARRGLRPGFGLSIQEMGDADIERWNLFLGRVQRRSEHRILVGASPARLTELTAGLAGAGYAVFGGTDAGTLVQLSDAEARPPDVAVIDATLFEGTEPNWLETLFSARKVPCVTLRGDARRARAVVDRLLAV